MTGRCAISSPPPPPRSDAEDCRRASPPQDPGTHRATASRSKDDGCCAVSIASPATFGNSLVEKRNETPRTSARFDGLNSLSVMSLVRNRATPASSPMRREDSLWATRNWPSPVEWANPSLAPSLMATHLRPHAPVGWQMDLPRVTNATRFVSPRVGVVLLVNWLPMWTSLPIHRPVAAPDSESRPGNLSTGPTLGEISAPECSLIVSAPSPRTQEEKEE